MRTIMKMAMKDLKLMSRDWLGMFFMIAFPVGMAIFFGAISGSFGGGESAEMALAIVDDDDSEMSQKFIEELTATGNVKIDQMQNDEARDSVRRGKRVGMIVIPAGFGETAGIMWADAPPIQIGVDPSRKAESGMIQGLVMQAMGKLTMVRFQDTSTMRSFVDDSKEQIKQSGNGEQWQGDMLKMLDSLDGFLESAGTVQQSDAGAAGAPEFELAKIETIDVTRQAAKGSMEELLQRVKSPWDLSFPQAMVWGVLACAAGFALSIVRETIQGTLVRLQVAPITRAQLLGGKAMACFISVMVVISLMTGLGVALGMRPGSPAYLLMAALCIGYCFVGIMMVMSVIGRTEEAVSGAAWGANVMMAMFGGGMIPLAFMPGFMKTLSNVSPVKWSVLAMEGAIWRGFSFSEMLLPCGILLGVGSAGIVIGLWLLSKRGI